jgi:hypothetical protein
MSYEAFKEINYRPETAEKLEKAEAILVKYRRQGYRLSLRQLFYQFVASAQLPNKHNEYKNLGTALRNGRLTGDIDWDDVEDRTRGLKGTYRASSLPDPNGLMDDLDFSSIVLGHFSANLWTMSQSWFPELWVEKNAAINVVARAAEEWGIPYFAGVGYASVTAVKAAAERFTRLIEEGI